MPSRNISPKLFAGIDNITFDTRHFDPSKKDILNICRFFALGELQNFEKEKGVRVSHSNHFVFLKTTQGEFALKFYPSDAANMIATEFAMNRFLTKHDFLTPTIQAGKNGQPSLSCNGRLAACYTYIKGAQAWQHIHKPKIIHQINNALFLLKEILLSSDREIPIFKQKRFSETINEAAKISRSIPSYDQKGLIESTLIQLSRLFRDHQALFKRQRLHNNATLTNFLIIRGNVYTLDLTHIQEDYIFSDLAAMLISCFFLDMPRRTNITIIDNYFTQHKIKKNHNLVLGALVKIGLIREYLKNVRRERSMCLLTHPEEIVRKYLFHLKSRKKLLIAALQVKGL